MQHSELFVEVVGATCSFTRSITGTCLQGAGRVRLRSELCLSCGQHGFELLLGLMVPCFASSLLQTHSARKNIFIDTEKHLDPCFIILNVLSFLAGVNDRGGAPDCTYGRKPASSLP